MAVVLSQPQCVRASRDGVTGVRIGSNLSGDGGGRDMHRGWDWVGIRVRSRLLTTLFSIFNFQLCTSCLNTNEITCFKYIICLFEFVDICFIMAMKL